MPNLKGRQEITGGLVIIMLVVLVIVVLAAVFYRCVLSDSITWSAEVARYVCVWIGFLSASLIMNDRGHIGLDFFVNKLPRSLNRFAILLELPSDKAAGATCGYPSQTHRSSWRGGSI